MGSMLNVEQQIKLCTEFSDLEIKQAMFFIPSDKSLRPDGFNSRFFKSAWDEIGPLICKDVQEFCCSGSLLRSWNSTNW